jgi:serine protease Do
MRSLMTKAALMLVAVTGISFPLVSASTEPGDSWGVSSEDAGGTSYLGVDTRDVTSDRLGPLQLKEERGVEVTMVDQDAPAGKAGLKERDVILSINGEAVQSVEQLRRMIREIPPGRVISVGISRNGQPMTIRAQLAGRKGFSFGPDAKDFHFAAPAIPAIPAFPAMPTMPDIDVPVSIVVVHSAARSGLMVENLTPQLGDFLGVKNGQGVMVRSVEKGSRAEKAGFRAGDVIIKINGESINDSGDFGHAIRGRKDNTVTIGIIRDKREQNLTLTLPDRKQSGVIEESMGIPETGAEVNIDLSNLRTQLAQIRPQVELAIRNSNVKIDVETIKREIETHQKEMKIQMRHLREMMCPRADI